MTYTAAATNGPAPTDLARKVRQLSWITLAWLTVDGIIGMTAGIAADSVALVGWGLDCAIQAAAALVVIWRFTGNRWTPITPKQLRGESSAPRFCSSCPTSPSSRSAN